jgi:flagellar protein FliO/FliZ
MRFSSTLTRGVALLGALVLTPASAALADSSAGHAAGTSEHTRIHLGSSAVHHASSSSSGILRTIIALVIVIAIIYVVARILKAVKGDRTRATGDGLEQLATLPLAQGRSLALVRSGADIVLVGVSESGVTPIRTYTEQEAIAGGLIPEPGPIAEPDPAESSFAWLDSLRRMTVRS